ncbi:MAG: glycoside hydrolase family 15 protein [Candidatus Woesearchaeota archaeon]
MIKKLFKRICANKLKRLQYRSGLFAASNKTVRTGYNVAWIRDNIYEALGLEQVKDIEAVKRTYAALFDVFLKYEWKIELALKNKPQFDFEYIHARYDPESLSEFKEPWGNKQNDAIGAFLFKVGDLFKQGIRVFRNDDDVRILQKLVYYLASIEYWQDPDNGIWENEEELHASSIGACVAGLKAISPIVFVPPVMVEYGEKALSVLLPKESASRDVDLALLSLIFPFNIVNESQKSQILWNVEKNLVRDKGVVRYFGDSYYSNGREAEWCFGFPWLAKIYKDMGNLEKYRFYIDRTHAAMNGKFELPELYYADTNTHNENSPLGWATAMYIIAVS